MALAASIGDPPPTETMISQPESVKSLPAALIAAMGECWPISQKVVPYPSIDFKTSSTFFTTSV